MVDRRLGRMKSVPKAIDARQPKIARSRKAPCVVHYRGADAWTALCGVGRALGQLVITLGSDCPRCLEIRALAQAEESKPMVFCGVCHDTEYRNWEEWDASEAAAEDARELGRRGLGSQVVPEPCRCCPVCSECGVEVARHTEEAREDMRANGGRPWDLPNCGRDEQ